MTTVFEDVEAMGVKLIAKRLKAALSKGMKAEEAAKATYEVLKKLAVEQGQSEREVAIAKPGAAKYVKNPDCWLVTWEAGPYEWAIPVSFTVMEATGKLVEPYYSFDLCFYPSED